MESCRDLTFEAVDELGIAFAEGLFTEDAALPHRFCAQEIGPLIELVQLVDAGIIPHAVVQDTIDTGALTEAVGQLRAGKPYWVSGGSGQFGIMRLGDDYGDDEETRRTGFGIKAKKAAESVPFAPALAGRLVGAVKELHSNIYEHSGHSRTGLVAFGVRDSMFEVVVTDRGVGALQSLRSNPKHADLRSEPEALRLALQPGISRLSDQGDLRGHGFDRMFTGLLNLNSTLRFRSGTGAVTIDGLSSSNPTPIVRERARIPGFLAAIACHAPAGGAFQIIGEIKGAMNQ